MAKRRELEQTSFLYGGNSSFIEELYARYLHDPAGVDPSWRAYFDELEPENRALFQRARAALQPQQPSRLRLVQPAAAAAPTGDLDESATKTLIRDHLRVIMLIRAYRVRGHLIAKLDPLGLTHKAPHPELDYRSYGFTDADLDREFYLDYVLGLEKATLRQIIDVLQKTYSGTVGIEFMHIQDPEQKSWIQARIEGTGGMFTTSAEEKREILEHLTETEGFEQFLHVKFPGTKRFGLDGGESTIPALETIIRTAAELGGEEIVIGMPHRGRLNVLANVMGKPYSAILSEFQGKAVVDEVLGSGDVKYHLGTSTDRALPDGRHIHLSLTANPSHLEAVNPVVMGKVRAKQTQKGDTERTRVLAILMHGDAAFIGQGVVHECLEMMDLKGYRIGGTIHLIVNNQIGFTTSPAYSRSSPYPSDVARGVQCPVFHVNGDDPGRGDPRGAAGDRVPPEVQDRRGDRPVVLPPPRPQRGRRAGLHPAADVQEDRPAPDRAADLRPPARGGQGPQGRRAAGALRRVHPAARGGARGLAELQVQQGRLARGGLVGPARGTQGVPARRHRGRRPTCCASSA